MARVRRVVAPGLPHHTAQRGNRRLNVFRDDPRNWDWNQYPQWANWGDCRLEKNDYVKQRLSQGMDSPSYVHAVTEKESRKLHGYNDSSAPPALSQLDASAGSYPETLQWSPVKA
jgi:hypothetical protein